MKKIAEMLLYAAMTAVATAIAAWVVIWILRRFALEGVIIFGICCVAAFWGWVIRWLHVAKRLTLSHILVIWMVASGTVMGGASYFLAYRGITATLETLSRYVMVETVAGSAGYFIKSGIENAIEKIKNRTKKDL